MRAELEGLRISREGYNAAHWQCNNGYPTHSAIGFFPVPLICERQNEVKECDDEGEIKKKTGEQVYLT